MSLATQELSPEDRFRLVSATTPKKSIAAGSATVSISAAITGLQPNTKYYFSALVNSVGGTSSSAIESFTTK